MKNRPTPNTLLKTIELVRTTYQPTKAEKDKTFKLRKPDGSTPTMEDLAQSLFKPVKPRWIEKPRKLR